MIKKSLIASCLTVLILTSSADARYYTPVPDATVLRESCPLSLHGYYSFGVLACTDTSSRTIYAPDGCDFFCLAHEYGHVFSSVYLDDPTRSRWAALVGQSLGSWYWTPERAANFDPTTNLDTPPADEKFADAYALCAIGARTRRGRVVDKTHYLGTIGYGLIDKRVVASTCWLVDHLAPTP